MQDMFKLTVEKEHSKTHRRIAFAFVVMALSLSVFASQQMVFASQASATFHTERVYIEIRALRNYGNWVDPNETPSSVINTITEMREATNTSLNLYAIVSGPQSPGQMIKGTTVGVDDFLLQAKAASGGHIVPELNLNYYTSDIKSLDLNQKSNYCDPLNATNCGPSWFYQVSEELLNLKAVAIDKNKILELDAWDQFSRDVVVAGLPANTSNVVLATLHSEGWNRILLKTENYFPDNGTAHGVVVTTNPQSTSPYMQPETGMLSKWEGAGDKGFVHFDRQNQNSPNPPTALYQFLAVLNPDQQAVALTNLAGLQGHDNYKFVYPIFTYTARDNVTYYWDANTNLQSNGKPFLDLIDNLILQSK